MRNPEIEAQTIIKSHYDELRNSKIPCECWESVARLGSEVTILKLMKEKPLRLVFP